MKEGAGSTKTIIHRHQQQIKKKAACLAPPVSWVKMNSNVTFCLRTGRASIGVVARDQKGDVTPTFCKNKNFVQIGVYIKL
jgi:hypothetical protein